MLKEEGTTEPVKESFAVLGRIFGFLQVGTIRARLLIAFVVMVLLSTAAVTVVSTLVGMRSARRQAIEQLELKVAFRENEVSAWVDSVQADLSAAFESINIRYVRDLFEASSGSAVYRVMKSHWSEYAKQTQQFEELLLLNSEGMVIVSTKEAESGADHSERSYFQEGLNGPCAHLFFSLSSGRVKVAVAQPVVDEGQTLGVFVGYTSMETLEEMMQEWAGLSETGRMFLVGSDHAQLTGLTLGRNGVTKVNTWAVDTVLADHTNGTGAYEDRRGVAVVGAFRWLPQLQVALLVEQDQAEAFRSTYEILAVNIVIALVAATCAVVASLFVTRSIVGPLAELVGIANRVADGDLELSSHIAEVERGDEVGVMAQAFRRMTVRLSDLLTDEQQQREHLQSVVQACVVHMKGLERGDLTLRLDVGEGESVGEDDPLYVLGHRMNRLTEGMQGILGQIHSASNELGSATAEILATTTQQASGASEQSAAIAETTTTVDELKTIAEQSVGRAQEVAGTSKRTVEVSRAGREAVVAAIGSMGEIRARVEGIAENILTLSEQTQQIGEIISTVNEIASQSNILALNASVEAARAGEYGKGFAVVAAEVRSLAEQSRQATAQVRAILSDIQGATNATVMATEEGTKGVEEGMRLAGKAGEAIEELAGVIEESAQAAAQMVAGGRQQAAGVEQVAVAMQSINQATVQSLASTREAEKAARELNDLARSLSGTVEQYRL